MKKMIIGMVAAMLAFGSMNANAQGKYKGRNHHRDVHYTIEAPAPLYGPHAASAYKMHRHAPKHHHAPAPRRHAIHYPVPRPVVVYHPTPVPVLPPPAQKDFPGGPVVKLLPVNVGDTGSIPGPGRLHMPMHQNS